MRLLCLSTWSLCPPDNGSRQRAYHLVKGLAHDHSVTVAAFHWGEKRTPSATEKPLPGVEIHLVEADPYRHVNMPAVARYASPIPLAFWPSRAMQQVMGDLRKSKDWDAVIAFQSPVAQYALSLGIPRILDIDTALGYQMYERALATVGRIARLRAVISWQKAYRYEAFLVRRFCAATVVSDREVGFVQSMAHNTSCRVVVVPNGVDTAHNRPGLVHPCSHSLVYNGALGYSANYDAMHYFLAEIYPLIKREVPDVTMAITGSTRNVDLATLALDDSVTLTGYVNDVRVSVASAAVCVVPLRLGGGTRLKILEAMALGTPVVATSKGVEGLDVVDGEHCLIADSPKAFAAQTVSLLRSGDLRHQLATNARRLVEGKYDWEQIGRQFVSLIEETVDSSCARKGKS